MAFDDAWQQSLIGLKSGFLRHIDEQTPASRAALNEQIEQFTLFVESYKGVLRTLPEAQRLVECWSIFVSAVQSTGNASVTAAVEDLLNAIDNAVAKSVVKSQPYVLHALTTELDKLITQMRLQADESAHGDDIDLVMKAKHAATTGDGPAALNHLKKVTTWALSVAEKIGVGVAIALIKASLVNDAP